MLAIEVNCNSVRRHPGRDQPCPFTSLKEQRQAGLDFAPYFCSCSYEQLAVALAGRLEIPEAEARVVAKEQLMSLINVSCIGCAM